MRRFLFAPILVLAGVLAPIGPAQAAVAWSYSSPKDTFNRSDLSPAFDVEYIAASRFDDDSSDTINFFLFFKNVPDPAQFNDGQDSWAAVFIDVNGDGKRDFTLQTTARTYPTDRTSVSGYAYDDTLDRSTSCQTEIWTNIAEQKTWFAFKVSQSCLRLPASYAIQGYTDRGANDGKDYDYVPESYVTIAPPATGSSTGGSAGGSSSTSLPLAASKANATTEVVNYSASPADLSKLSATIMPSVVTVGCANGSGSGWAADVTLPKGLIDAGYRTYVLTNHHVIADCVTTGKVTLTLSSKATVAGTIVGWDSAADVAAVATSASIPALQWFGTEPKQGWWIGVIGSPLGNAGILTTGVVSSIDAILGSFTLTAAINPGNSGGPVFDVTGRVLGLATSKSILNSATGQLAEGMGHAKGTPLLCGTVVICSVETKPWGATPATRASASSGSTSDADKALSDARAEAAKIVADARTEAARIVADAQASLTTAKSQVAALEGTVANLKAALASLQETLDKRVTTLDATKAQLAAKTAKLAKICAAKPKPKGC